MWSPAAASIRPVPQPAPDHFPWPEPQASPGTALLAPHFPSAAIRVAQCAPSLPRARSQPLRTQPDLARPPAEWTTHWSSMPHLQNPPTKVLQARAPSPSSSESAPVVALGPGHSKASLVQVPGTTQTSQRRLHLLRLYEGVVS